MDTKIDMKKLCLLILTFLSLQHQYAQAPARINYQSVIRNSSNNLLVNTPVKIRVSILQGSATGSVVFSELLNPTTNNVGLIQLEIGSGSNQTGTISGIDWSKGPYFLKTETDPLNGSNYTLVGTTQILSVPYALSSGNGIKGISISGDTLYLDNGKKFIIPGIKDVSSVALVTGVTSHTCGAASVHNPSVAYGSLTDQDGNIYRTVQIGTQTWMAENLNVATFRNGDPIPEAKTSEKWEKAGIEGKPAWCYYNNNPSIGLVYGKLYNWYAINDPRGISPVGFHVPSDKEWIVLIDFLSNDDNPGAQLKNGQGFSGFFGGERDKDGYFNQLDNYGYWWSSTERKTNNAWYHSICSYNDKTIRGGELMSVGFSLRCIKD